jgi:peptide/nickel transport system substrate-binding protein
MRHLALFIFYSGCLLLFSTCGTKQSSNKNIFRINQVQGVESLDPAFAKNLNIMWHVQQGYNRLVEFDAQRTVQPSLATRWEISADRLTYRFYLRNDVYFHPNPVFPEGKGRKMIASDVVYSFQRLIDPKTASPGAWVFNERVDTLRPFIAINDTIFELRLQKPFNPMLGILSMQYCSIVPKEVVEHWGDDFRAHPCGTGPFIMQDWEENVALTYRKNEHYWERDSLGNQLPYLDGLLFTFIDSKATEFLMFQQGELDFMNGLDATFKDQVLTKQGTLKPAFQNNIRLIKNPYLNVEYLGFLLDPNKQQQKILLEKKLRQAIQIGFDREKMVMYLRNHIGHPADAGFIPNGLPGYNPTRNRGFAYQPENARALIAEVKAANGGQLPAIILLSNDNYSDRCQFIASQLSDIGLTVRIEIVQPSLLREQMSDSKADFFWATWIADYPDAESYLSLFYSHHAAPPNYTRFANQTFDDLYEAALQAETNEKQIDLYEKMDSILIAESPVIPLFYDEVMHFIQPRVQGWESNSLNLMDLRKVRLSVVQ